MELCSAKSLFLIIKNDGCVYLCVDVCIIVYSVNLREDLRPMSFMENILDEFWCCACHEFPLSLRFM